EPQIIQGGENIVRSCQSIVSGVARIENLASYFSRAKRSASRILHLCRRAGRRRLDNSICGRGIKTVHRAVALVAAENVLPLNSRAAEVHHLFLKRLYLLSQKLPGGRRRSGTGALGRDRARSIH